MVQIDIPLAYITSQLFLDIGKKRIIKEAQETDNLKPAIYYKYFYRSILFATLVVAPVGIYFLAGWPGWEQMYWTDRVENLIFNWVNALYPPLFLIAIGLAGYLGHVLGYKWLVTGKEKYLKPSYISVLIAIAILVLFNYPAFILGGTYQDYHFSRESMEPLWNNPQDFLYGYAFAGSYFLISFIYMVVKIRKESK